MLFHLFFSVPMSWSHHSLTDKEAEAHRGDIATQGHAYSPLAKSY